MNQIDVTSVRLVPGARPVLAFADITLNNEFAVHGLRIVDKEGRMLVCMPSRVHVSPCRTCHHRNPVSNKFCGSCGAAFAAAPADKHYLDVAHPINASVRERIEQAVLGEYRRKTGDTPAAA